MENIDQILDLYNQNTVDISRIIQDGVVIISIPRDLVGMRIEPTSFRFDFTSKDNTIDGVIVDNGDGKLLLQSIDEVTGDVQVESKIGDIIYPHGIVIINEIGTDAQFYYLISGSENYDITWKSNEPIYTGTYLCKVSDYEFNHTTNPTAVKPNSVGELIDQVTGSEFRPYITGIGLYNDANELLGVAKLGQPVPKTSKVDTTFVIKIDY